MMLPRSNLLPATIVTAIAMATISLLTACGGDPKYVPPAIVVTFSTEYPPPSALDASATAGIAAVVTNGPQNPEVKFTCLPMAACGTFSPNPIASGIPTTYQAPPTVPAGGTVTITATSITDPTKFASATITID
jgi:hypothetical protein